jgi:hypothetical protein
MNSTDIPRARKRSNSRLESLAAIIAYVLGLAWAVYAYHAYLPGLNPDAFRDVLLRLLKVVTSYRLLALSLLVLFSTTICLARRTFAGRHLRGRWWEGLNPSILFVGALVMPALLLDPMTVLIVSWLCVVAHYVGKMFVSATKIQTTPGIESVVLRTAAGFSLLSLLTLLLGILRLLYPVVAWTVLLFLTFCWMKHSMISDWKGLLWAQGGTRVVNNALIVFLLFGFIAVNLAVVLISALGPAIEFDDVAYHLTGPKTFIDRHALAPIPDMPHTFLPKNIEMLFTFAMLLHNEVAAKLLHFVLGLLAMLLCFAYARRILSPAVGLVAFALLVSSPLFMWEMRTAHIDVGLAVYLFLALYACLQWLRNGDKGWLSLAVYFTAFSLGIKYHGLFGLLSLSAVIFGTHLFRTGSLRVPVRQLACFCALASLGLLPWGIINFILTQNPLFPLLNDLFQSPYWTPRLNQMAIEQLKEGNVMVGLSNWWEIAAVFWQMLVDRANRFHGRIGPFLFVLIPLLVFARNVNREIKLILAFSLCYWMLWIFTAQHSRYLLAVLPGLSIVAAYAGVQWGQQIQAQLPRGFALAAVGLFCFMAALCTPFFGRYGTHAHYGSSLMASLPLRYLLGRESKEAFIARHVASYPLVQHFNRLPGHKKVLFWWNAGTPSTFYVEGKSAWLFCTFAPGLFSDNPAKLLHILWENEVTHLIMVEEGSNAGLLVRSDGPFVRHDLRKLATVNQIGLYEIKQKAETHTLHGSDEESGLECTETRARSREHCDLRRLPAISRDHRGDRA